MFTDVTMSCHVYDFAGRILSSSVIANPVYLLYDAIPLLVKLIHVVLVGKDTLDAVPLRAHLIRHGHSVSRLKPLCCSYPRNMLENGMRTASRNPNSSPAKKVLSPSTSSRRLSWSRSSSLAASFSAPLLFRNLVCVLNT